MAVYNTCSIVSSAYS